MPKSPYTVAFYCADQNIHRDRSRGITSYTRELLTHLRDTKAANLVALVSKSSFAVPEGIAQIALPFASDWLPGRLLADHFHPLIAPRVDADIWHYPKGFLPMGFQFKAIKVGSVADVMLQRDADHHPESRSRAAFAYWLAMLRHSLSRLDLVLTLTEYSRQDILRFCDRYRIKPPPIVVAYVGVTVSDLNAQAFPEKGDYVLHLASHLPHKATGWLLQQWARLGELAANLPELRLVGTLDESAAERLSKMRNVRLTPPLPRQELGEMMAGARALLLPSEIEGFGIPAVEAYLLGTPVAYVKETAVEEVIGEETPGGFYRNFDSFRQAISDVLGLEPAMIATKGAELARRFTWENCVRFTVGAYAQLL
ncbi:MAG: glycosyltransferase [Chthoniobacterales bacterium]